MECFPEGKKPHAVCIPLPFQGHINPMLKLAKLLHSKGFHITFVNTEFNHQKVLKARGPDSLNGLPDFRFETIPDGLPPSDADSSQDMGALFVSITQNCLDPVRNLVTKLNEASKSTGDPPVSCIVPDAFMTNALGAAEEFGITGVILFILSAAVLTTYLHYEQIFEKILLPLKGVQDKREASLHMPIDFIAGIKDVRLKDLSAFLWLNNDNFTNLPIIDVERAARASAIILNTFDALESEVLVAIKSLLPPIYTIGPLLLLEQKIPNHQLKSINTNLLKESQECLEWLDSKQPNSVVYVNFGSSTVMTSEQLIEFAWGLANSKHPFLWVIRPDLVIGEAAILPPEFKEEVADRGMISGWCPQEEVLGHSSTGVFLTHSGWNSTMDTICGGVPVISWPYFGDQPTNCWYACEHWGIGTRMDNNVKRDEVEGLVRKIMESEKGKGMKENAMEWKKKAEESTKPGGSSYENFDKLVKELLVQK